MEKRILLLNCQYASPSGSGGAGVYADHLAKYLDHNQESLSLILQLDNKPVDSKSSARKPLKGILREVAQRSLPPKLYGGLLNVYRSARNRNKPVIAEILPTEEATARPNIIAHEITNYSSHPDYALGKIKNELKLVTTFLDLQDYFYPEFFSNHEILVRRKAYSFYRDYCDHFIAISEYTKSTMVELLKIPANKISVVHLGSNSTMPEPDPVFEGEIASMGPYLLYPAKLWPHKNHQTLFKAMAKAQSTLRENKFSLLLTGGFNPFEVQKLKSELEELGIEDLVRPMGFLSHNHLKLLVTKAEYLIFPSLFEGFGMPVVEAMQLGCPVLASNITSLPEVCGDAAVLFDPKNVEQIAKLLTDVAQGKIDRKSLILKGFENSKRFTWEACMKQTAKIYENLYHS